MKDILINFYCPSTSRSYDFWIPKAMTAEKIIEKVCGSICKLENNDGIFPNMEALILCSYLTGRTLPRSLSLEQAGIRCGDKLALI